MTTPATVSQTLSLDAGLHLFVRRLPTRDERHALLAAARAKPTPAERRAAFVVGCLCTPAGEPMTLPPDEAARLSGLTPDDWDDVLTKAAHLNGFAPLQVITN